MALRRKSRRLEELQDAQGDLRRSPRLRERYSRERSEDPTLLIAAHTVTSRPGLSGYLRQKQLEEQADSILNESGQSVPYYFDLGHDATVTHPGLNDTGEAYDSPDPQHLYGLDTSEDECGPVDAVQGFLGSPLQTSDDGGGPKIGWVMSGLMGILFRLGSLLYLAATLILCLDVIILHRCYIVFSTMACWSNHHAATRPWLRFWILPVVLLPLVAILIGGGLVPISDSPPYNITDTELSKLHSSLTASLRSTLSLDVHHYVEEHVDKVVKEWIENKLESELKLSNAALQEVKSLTNLEISTVKAEMEVLKGKLKDIQIETTETYVTEAVVLQILQAQLRQHLDAAKQDWLKLIPQEMMAVTEAMDELRADVDKMDKHYLEQLSLLEKLIASNNNSITATLLELISQLDTAYKAINGLTSGADSQAIDIAALKEVISQLSLADKEKRVVERLEGLELAGLSVEDVAQIFDTELKKSFEANTGVLWVWLSQVLDNVDIPHSGLTKKDVIELITAELHRYSADRIAKFDFALENSGGGVVSTSGTYPPALETFRVFGVPIWSVPSSPKTIIQPHVYPGDCWAMNGTSGYALIRLKEAVVVTSVTVEHIPKELSPYGSLSSAPKKFRVLGKNTTDTTGGDILGHFSYSTDGTPIQEFNVTNEGVAYTHILFEFLSNHGNDYYTCVYRVRVHGCPATTVC